MRRTLIHTAAFIRAAKRFAKKQAGASEAVRKTLIELEADAFNSVLHTHKLKGELSGCWSCSAGYDLRIVFQLTPHGGGEAIALLSLGTHDEVY